MIVRGGGAPGGSCAAAAAAVPYRNHVAQALAHARTHDAEAFFRSKLADIDEPTAPFGLLDVHGDGSQIEEAHQELEPRSWRSACVLRRGVWV